MKKYLKPVLALVFIAALAVGGTLAYLTDDTQDITNTFTAGKDIDITLTETDAVADEKEYTVVPGSTEAKDPTVTLEAGSADSYIFVDVIEYLPAGLMKADGTTEAVFSDYIEYSLEAAKWGKIGEVIDKTNNTITTTYAYIADNSANPVVVSAETTDTVMPILKDTKIDDALNGSVTYPISITTDMLNAIKGDDKQPTLTFTAYALQVDNIAADAAVAQFKTAFGKTF